FAFFFFKQKTAYDIGLGIPAEPLFRSRFYLQMTTSTTSIDIMGLQAAYANLHTDQERDYFMQRYHDVISSFGGKTSYDADNRPRSEERRVGKECRFWGWLVCYKKKLKM